MSDSIKAVAICGLINGSQIVKEALIRDNIVLCELPDSINDVMFELKCDPQALGHIVEDPVIENEVESWNKIGKRKFKKDWQR